jgi:hypothetical protein
LELIYSNEINNYDTLKYYDYNTKDITCQGIYTSKTCWNDINYKIPRKYRYTVGYCGLCMVDIMSTIEDIVRAYGGKIFNNINERYMIFKKLNITTDDVFKLILNDLIQLYLQ